MADNPDTPWDEPADSSPEFAVFMTGQLWQYDPWTRIRGQVKSERCGGAAVLTVFKTC